MNRRNFSNSHAVDGRPCDFYLEIAVNVSGIVAGNSWNEIVGGFWHSICISSVIVICNWVTETILLKGILCEGFE